MSAPRGIRNNNPGNIRRSKTVWRGERSTETDPSFCQFVSMQYGVRALAKLLLAYHMVHHINTVKGLIGRWAPPIENMTGAYVAAVSKVVGVQPSTVLEFDAPTLVKLCDGIIRHENGMSVPLDVITEGVKLAL